MPDNFTNNGAVRVLLNKVDDSSTEQYTSAAGFEDETWAKVMRIQPHGFSSHPVKDSHALGVAIGGRRDMLLLLGGEHPDHRPKNLDPGDVKLYNSTSGTSVHLKGADVAVAASGKMDVTVPTITHTASSITFKCGGTTVVIDAGGVTVTGGKVKHDGKNIGSTHRHTDVLSGPGNTGLPV